MCIYRLTFPRFTFGRGEDILLSLVSVLFFWKLFLLEAHFDLCKIDARYASSLFMEGEL